MDSSHLTGHTCFLHIYIYINMRKIVGIPVAEKVSRKSYNLCYPEILHSIITILITKFADNHEMKNWQLNYIYWTYTYFLLMPFTHVMNQLTLYAPSLEKNMQTIYTCKMYWINTHSLIILWSETMLFAIIFLYNHYLLQMPKCVQYWHFLIPFCCLGMSTWWVEWKDGWWTFIYYQVVEWKNKENLHW